MADRFPLILNTSTNQIQEIPSGDNLDLTGVGINNVGVITSGNVQIGAATTDLVVTGDARITGILTVGTSSLKLDGPNNLVNVGTALTLGHTQGLQFHTQNLHSAGFEVNQINASGIITATEADINGDLDVDGHTNLDNVSVAGILTATSSIHTGTNLQVNSDTGKLKLGASQDLQLYHSGTHSFVDDVGTGHLNIRGNQINIKNTDDNLMLVASGGGAVNLYNNGSAKLATTTSGISVTGNATISGNLSVGGVLTYEDVTNVDSVGIITARDGINCTTDGVGNGVNIGAGSDLILQHNGTNSYIDNNTGDLYIQTTGSGDDILIESADDFTVKVAGSETAIQATGDASVDLYFNNNHRFSTANYGSNVFGQSAAVSFQLYTAGGGKRGSLYATNGNVISLLDGQDHTILRGVKDGTAELYFDNSKKFETTNDGGSITGDLSVSRDVSISRHLDLADSSQLRFGSPNGFNVYHDGNHTYMINQTGNLYISDDGGNVHIRGRTNEESIVAYYNGSVDLYYDNSRKFQTTANGIVVYGPEGGGGLINLYADEGDDNADKWRLHSNPNGTFYLQNYTSGSWENSISSTGNSGTSLYFDNAVTLTTTVNALHLFGNTSECNIDLKLSTGVRCGFLGFTNSGRVQINGAAGGNPYETYLEGNLNGATKLFYDNVAKFETSSTGATVTGALSVTGDITVPTSMDSTETGGVGIQRFWSTSTITAGNVYKCGQWYTGEGAVQLLIAVRSHTAGNSGTTTYMYQGGFSAISSTGIARLLPLTVGTGHGNGPDNGTNSNAWEVLIDNINNYTYAVYVHVPSGVANKNLRVTVTELGRGFTFTDLSSTVAYSSLTVQSSPILSSNYNHFGHTYLRDNYKINLGNSNDLQLFHDGSHSYIHDTGTGNLRIRGDDVEITDNANNNNMARFIEQGGVELYYNNSKHFEVTSFGAETVYSSGGGSIPIFKTLHGNRSQGIGLGYNGITAIGTNANVELFIKPKGTSSVYLQRDNGNNMLRAIPGGEVILYHNGEETAQTYNTNGRKAFLVGDKQYINSGLTHGELIVRKNLGSPNNASIAQCARITVATNEQTAGGNGYGGAVYFMGQDVSTTNQYAEYAAIGAKMHSSADLANTTPNCDFSVFTRQGSSFSEGFRVRYDGTIYAHNTSVQSLSDIRLKENIEDYSFDLNKFKQFKPVTFNWKKPECHPTTESGKHRGFIAQDVQKLDSYLLTSEYDLDKDSEERELVDEDGIGLTSTLGDKDAMYVSVIQQLIDKIEKLETEVASLKGS